MLLPLGAPAVARAALATGDDRRCRLVVPVVLLAGALARGEPERAVTPVSTPPLPAPSLIDDLVLLVLPLSVMFLLALAGSPGLRARLGGGLAFGLAALAVPPALTYLAVLAGGRGF